jgi:hypothetical protein
MDKSAFRPDPERTVPDVSKSTVLREEAALSVIFKENPPTSLKPEAVTGTDMEPVE